MRSPPTHETLKQCASSFLSLANKYEMPPRLYFFPPADSTQVYNYLLDFLHYNISITIYCTVNKIYCAH